MSEAIRWIEPFQYQPGQPFRVMPAGTFQRGERTLEITAQRLQAMAKNYEDNRPRWKIPIYAGHPTDANPDPPKLGNIARLEAREDGLYATPEYSEEGQQLAQEGYQYVSPGVLWSLNGSAYTDEQGQEFDNVIDHVALTNRPFFGANTALFSAEPALLEETFAMWSTAMMNDLPDSCFLYIEPGGQPDADGKTTPRSLRHFPYKDASGKVDLPHLRNALARIPQSGLPAEIKDRIAAKARRLAGDAGIETADAGIGTSEATSEMTTKEQETMSDKTTVTAPPVPPVETLAVQPDEFAALKAKAEKAEQMEAQVNALRQQADQFAAALKTAKAERRHDQLIVKYEAFTAIPEKAATLAEKMQALEEHDAGLFAYFDALLAKLDADLTQAGLFSQYASERAGETAETLEACTEQLVREKFSGDMSKYAEAFEMAQRQRPDLAEAYRFRGRK